LGRHRTRRSDSSPNVRALLPSSPVFSLRALIWEAPVSPWRGALSIVVGPPDILHPRCLPGAPPNFSGLPPLRSPGPDDCRDTPRKIIGLLSWSSGFLSELGGSPLIFQVAWTSSDLRLIFDGLRGFGAVPSLSIFFFSLATDDGVLLPRHYLTMEPPGAVLAVLFFF